MQFGCFLRANFGISRHEKLSFGICGVLNNAIDCRTEYVLEIVEGSSAKKS
jgi:hypothetical protein